MYCMDVSYFIMSLHSHGIPVTMSDYHTVINITKLYQLLSPSAYIMGTICNVQRDW
jgi:hypothetical protein